MGPGDLIWMGCASVVWDTPNESSKISSSQIVDHVYYGESMIVLEPVSSRTKDVKVVTLRGRVGWVAVDNVFGIET